MGVPRLHDTWKQGKLERACQAGPVQDCQYHPRHPVQAEPEDLETAHMGLQAFLKIFEMVFSQFNDQFMMIGNYAKKPTRLFARKTPKVETFTMLQYFYLLNHRPIGQVEYALL